MLVVTKNKVGGIVGKRTILGGCNIERLFIFNVVAIFVAIW